MSEQRLQMLLDRYLDGALSEDDRAELEHVLLASPSARATFWQSAGLHAVAMRWGQEAWGRRMAEPAPATLPVRSWRPYAARWIAAGLAAAACIVWVVVSLTKPAVVPEIAISPDPVGPAGVAMITSEVEATWESPPKSATLTPGTTIELRSGAALVEFFSGARLVAQGPARLTITSETEATCGFGRFSAYVPPPARGFTLRAGSLAVVDLGTEFGVNIPASGPPEVHVFNGAVSLSSDGIAAGNLSGGEACRIEGAVVRRLAASPQSFLRESQYMQLADAENRRRHREWTAFADALSRDPSAVGHYIPVAENFRDRTIANRVNGSGASPATIIGCEIAEGRWPSGRAVEFHGGADRVRLDIPGGFKAVTLLAWIRLEEVRNGYLALLAPDGLAEGTLRWGLMDGRLRLGIARSSGKPEPNWEAVMSDSVVLPHHAGRWLLVASTFDGRNICHYVNGERVKSLDAFCPVPLLIGPAEIGNWRGTASAAIRGRIDELAVLRRAMTADELKQVFNAGRQAEAPSR